MKELVSLLKPHIKEISFVELKVEGAYRGTLKASIIKAYEFLSLWISDSETNEINPYFHLGALRGICEDYIVLAFFLKLQPNLRDDAIENLNTLKFVEATKRQAEFFSKNRSFQPVIVPKNPQDQKSACMNRLKEIASESGLWNPKIAIPKINWMAESLGLKEFYNFYYCITSEAVHFNPRALLRMGWGDTDTCTFTFSTENFSQYYKDFALVYSTVLMNEYLTTFQEELTLQKEVIEIVKQMNDWLHQLLRWPEPVTYEEMNHEGPSQFVRILMQAFQAED